LKKEDKILFKIKKVVNRIAPGSDVFLYGSRARGDSFSQSDWDILILLNSQENTFDFEIKFIDELYEIEIQTGEIISGLIYTKADWYENHSGTPLFENVQKEGIRIV
jgi:uncharacterized protein